MASIAAIPGSIMAKTVFAADARRNLLRRLMFDMVFLRYFANIRIFSDTWFIYSVLNC